MQNLDLPPNGCPEEREVERAGPLVASLWGIFRFWRSDTGPPKRQSLPYEVYWTIIFFYINSLIHARDVRQYRFGCGGPEQKKALISAMLVSKSFHELICRAWNPYWLSLGLPVPHMLILADPLTFFKLPTFPVDLSNFTHLRFASLTFEDAFEYAGNVWQALTPVARFPPSLRELELLWSHSSENQMIDFVKTYCPQITTLRLVFCTMFNQPRCVWWAGHQLLADHGHYLRGHDVAEVEEYARNTAIALRGLHLKTFHLGVYFTPLQAIDDHRTMAEHVKHHPAHFRDSKRWSDRWRAQGIQNLGHFVADWNAQHDPIPPPDTTQECLADKRLWAKPCPRCVGQWSGRIERAERLAATILALEHPSLQSVSFASFVGEGRTSPSQWTICRCSLLWAGGSQLGARSKRPGTSGLSVKRLFFRRSGSQGQLVHVDRGE